MAVSRAPQRPPVNPAATEDHPADEQAVLAVIQRGGTVQADHLPLEPVITDPVKNVQLRLYQSTLEEMDQARRQRAGGRRPISRHAWMVQAIEEKLQRER